jgi:hypothetical protein
VFVHLHAFCADAHTTAGDADAGKSKKGKKKKNKKKGKHGGGNAANNVIHVLPEGTPLGVELTEVGRIADRLVLVPAQSVDREQCACASPRHA